MKASVCIPQNYKYSIKIAPKPPENNISIVISHIQVTEIAAKSCHMTIIFDLEVKWNDSRILLVKDKVPIFLANEDQNQIWSPRFRIGKNLVSHNKQMDDELILRQYKNRTSASKKSYLSATFKCEIVFYNFPFNKNLCRLEVRKYFYGIIYCYYLISFCYYSLRIKRMKLLSKISL